MKNSIDLNANTVTIPLERLIEVAQTAVGLSRTAIERDLSAIQNAMFYYSENLRKMKNHARDLSEHAEQLENAFDVLYGLEEAKDRENLVIIK